MFTQVQRFLNIKPYDIWRDDNGYLCRTIENGLLERKINGKWVDTTTIVLKKSFTLRTHHSPKLGEKYYIPVYRFFEDWENQMTYIRLMSTGGTCKEIINRGTSLDKYYIKNGFAFESKELATSIYHFYATMDFDNVGLDV